MIHSLGCSLLQVDFAGSTCLLSRKYPCKSVKWWNEHLEHHIRQLFTTIIKSPNERLFWKTGVHLASRYPESWYQGMRKVFGGIWRSRTLKKALFWFLLSVTQGTLQKFVDDLFTVILSTSRPVPLAVKYFFDLLDEQAAQYGISDPETIHIWKTNR